MDSFLKIQIFRLESNSTSRKGPDCLRFLGHDATRISRLASYENKSDYKFHRSHYVRAALERPSKSLLMK
jgi:hypothetical protein